MDSDQYTRERAIFEAAILLSGGAREAFLDQACGGDDQLRRRLLRLLKYDEQDEAQDEPVQTDVPACGIRPAVPLSSAMYERTGDQIVQIATIAPDFKVTCITPAADRERVSLASYRGRWLILIFYPRDFSLVCPTELTALSARIEEFREIGAEVLGISVDSLESHERWLATPRGSGGLGRVSYSLASDEGGNMSRAYGVYLEQQHVALRGVFIIDPNGILQYKSVHNLSVGRRSDDILRVVSALQTGGLCDENWSPGQTVMDTARILQPGNIVSHYRLEEHIGEGAYGTVFCAQDMTLNRKVALKVLKSDSPLSPQVMLEEARAAAALNHINICTVFAVDDVEGIPFIAMEYIDGKGLRDMIDEGPLETRRAIDIGRQIAEGMAQAHSMNISHGDLKPGNVMVRGDGVVKILDFGLARLCEHMVDDSGSITRSYCKTCGLKGTPAYMSPEQACGKRATYESDVFSLGVMLYEMLTGKCAFPGPSIPEILDQVLHVTPERLAEDVPEPVGAILTEALVPNAGQRTLTMAAFASKLSEQCD